MNGVCDHERERWGFDGEGMGSYWETARGLDLESRRREFHRVSKKLLFTVRIEGGFFWVGEEGLGI